MQLISDTELIVELQIWRGVELEEEGIHGLLEIQFTKGLVYLISEKYFPVAHQPMQIWLQRLNICVGLCHRSLKVQLGRDLSPKKPLQ